MRTSVDELLTTASSDVESGAVPACQIAVARDGEIVAFDTFGDATDTTRFCIFSATKPIVASAIWLLIADGHRRDPTSLRLHPRVRPQREGARDGRAGAAPHIGVPERSHEQRRRQRRAPPARPIRAVEPRVGAGHALRIPRGGRALGTRRPDRTRERRRLPRLHRAAGVRAARSPPRARPPARRAIRHRAARRGRRTVA